MATQNEIREQVNRLLTDSLTKKEIAWRQAWTPDMTSAMPTNVVTNFPYRDINPMILRIAAIRHGFRSKWWGTQRQWQALGGRVKPDANGTRTFKHQVSDDGPGILEPSFALVRSDVLFNLDSVDGDFDNLRSCGTSEFTDIKDGSPLWEVTLERGTCNIEAERLIHDIKAKGADIREVEGTKAMYYRPPDDYIITPCKLQFDFGPGGPEAFYSTTFHELAHFSESRLGWLADPSRSVKDRYALGELRADICSAYLCASVGIPPHNCTQGHAKYVKHWLRVMGEDNSMIFRIAKAANAAADYLLSMRAT